MKNHLKIFLFAICAFGPLWGEDSPQWQLDDATQGWKDETLALKYFHHSELQRQWAWHLLGGYRFTGNENILDFGCGDGKITAEVSHFIPHGKVTGVDLSPSMVNIASRCFPSAHFPNVSYRQTLDIDFSDESDAEKFDLIYSFCVFHLVANPVQVLENLRERLAEEGMIYLVIPAGNNPALFQAANEMFDKYQLPAPWAGKGNESNPFTMRTPEGCSSCLVAAGLKPISIVPLHSPTAFFNKQELVEWMLGTVVANWKIPFNIAEEFLGELIDRMAELDEDVVDEEGVYHLKFSRIEVIAR